MSRWKVNADKCVKCGRCVSVCRRGVLSRVNGTPVMLTNKTTMCVSCGLCASECPADAISVQKGGAVK